MQFWKCLHQACVTHSNKPLLPVANANANGECLQRCDANLRPPPPPFFSFNGGPVEVSKVSMVSGDFPPGGSVSDPSRLEYATLLGRTSCTRWPGNRGVCVRQPWPCHMAHTRAHNTTHNGELWGVDSTIVIVIHVKWLKPPTQR